MKKIFFFVLFVFAFCNTIIAQIGVMALSKSHQQDDSIIYFHTSNIDSISVNSLAGKYQQTIWTKDSIYNAKVDDIDSLSFCVLPNVVAIHNYSDWTEAIFNLSDKSSAFIKESSNGLIDEVIAFVPNTNSDSLSTCYIKIEESGTIPSVIIIDDISIYPSKLSDNYICATVLLKDTLCYFVDSIACNLQSPQTRAWGENNGVRNTCAVIGTIAGGIAIGLGVAALLPAEATTAALVGGALLITSGIINTVDGLSKILVPADSPLYLGGNDAATVEGLAYDGVNTWGKLAHTPRWANWTDLAGILSTLTDEIWGKTVTQKMRINLISQHIETGLSKEITIGSATLRGYINPLVFIDPMDGNTVDYYYGIMVQSQENNSLGTEGSFDGIFDKREYNGAGNVIEYTFSGLKENTSYDYFMYYVDKTNGISVMANTKNFTTKSYPVLIEKVEVTTASYYPNHYTYNGQKYSFQYKCSTTATVEDDENIEEWGYVYEDPDGNKTRIPLTEFGTSYTDARYAYCRNESKSTIKLYGYVKYKDDEQIYYSEPQEFDIEYPEEASVTLTSCNFLGTEKDVSFEGKTYKYKSSYKYYFKASGAYWLKVGTAESGTGWNLWELPNYTTSPVDGSNALTVNYYYDDKEFTGDYNVYLEGTDATHSKTYKTTNYVTYTYSNNQFTGCTFNSGTTAKQMRLHALDAENDVYNIVINKFINK